MKFTRQQLTAINAPHDRNTIVTAAAGSGKTTLLVDRILRLLSDRSLGITADTLAIMTFTRNAAASLKTKLIKKINARIKELSAENSEQAAQLRAHLSEQSIALRTAAIGTIDSFCISVIKENVHAFGLPMNFSIADKAKVFSMKSLAMKRTLAYFYEKNEADKCSPEDISPEERRVLFYTFSFEDDEELQESISGVFEKISSFSDRAAWMKMCLAEYDSFESMTEKFIPIIANKVNAIVSKNEKLLGRIRAIADDYAHEQADRKSWTEEAAVTLYAFAQSCADICAVARRGAERLKSHPTPQALSDLFNELSAAEPAAISRKDPQSPAKKRMTAEKKKFRLIEELGKLAVDISEEQRIFPQQKTAVNAFIKLLKKYEETYRSIMQTNGTLDFAECEYLLLEKLRADEEFRKQLSARFSCIVVDEFQDSNDIQAEIFRLISGEKNDLFYVGDVKQSIYAFRGGNPKIMEQLTALPKNLRQICRENGRTVLRAIGSGEKRAVSVKLNGANPADMIIKRGGFTVIPLNKNFRSRKSVVDSVNRLFSGVMTRKFGGVDYSDGAQLELGSDSFYEVIPPERTDDYATEIHLLNFGEEDSPENTDEETDAAQKQARFVASLIKNHVSEGFVVTDNGKLRCCRYSDFAILLRSNKVMGAYRDALAELNIPAVVPKDANFLSSEEISLIIDLLRVIDDPLKSEEMLRVMMSPLYGFTADETAQIRLGVLGFPLDCDVDLSPVAKLMRGRTLYGCLSYCSRETDLFSADSANGELQLTLDDLSKKGIKREVSPKVTRFLAQLEQFRFIMSNSSIEELIRCVYDETEMFNIICTYEGSRQRLSNIRLLQKYAADFEAADGGTLSDFLRFLSRLTERSLESANAPEDVGNSVSIMTFHASKGLEMPVCIIAGLEKKANMGDSAKPVLISSKHGIAMNYINSKERYRAQPLGVSALKTLLNDGVYSEELRLLYVAATRAIDKLILVGEEKKPLAELVPAANSPEFIFSDSVPLHWILRSALRGVTMGTAEALAWDSVRDGEQLYLGEDMRILFHTKEPLTEAAQPSDKAHAAADEQLKRQILANLSQSYPYTAQTVMQAKYSVTELAHSAEDTTDSVVYLNMPSFVTRGAPTGKEIGDAYHHFMEHCPLERIKSAADKRAELALAAAQLADGIRLTTDELAILTSDRYRCIDKLAAFFESDLGGRMLADLSQVRRETPFYAEVEAGKLGLTLPDGTPYSGTVSLQGRTDLFFYEKDGIVLVDYKSDSPDMLAKQLDSYCRQLLTYKEILPQVTGVGVKNVYIFGFSEGVIIDVDKHLSELRKKEEIT